MTTTKWLITILFWALTAGCVHAGNDGQESIVSENIIKNLTIGKAIWLEATKGKDFLALYTEIEAIYGNGVAVILHDRGEHPDQQKLVHDLRVTLPEHKWATLSLQMPILGNGASQEDYLDLFPDAAARINTGINYAKENGATSIVVVGYGLGAQMAVYALSQEKTPVVDALVAICLPVSNTDNKVADTLELVKKLNFPILDIYGSLDLAEIVKTAQKRRLAAKENPRYRQIEIDGQAHDFQHDEGLLVKRIYSWLNALDTIRAK